MRLHKRLALLALLALLAGGLVLFGETPQALRASGGLVNPGFEDGALNGNPAGWTVVNPVADVVRVVDTETPAEFPTYADMGNVTVSPYRGNLALRTGTPQRLAQNQNKGNNIVSQPFTATSSTLDFSFRVFSWEHRNGDLVKFDIKDRTGCTNPNRLETCKSVGDLAAPIQVKKANGELVASPCAVVPIVPDLPCQFTLDVGNQGEYLDSGWMVVNVTNLPVGHALTLSYQVSGTKDASHATWAYWDNVNTPPVAKFSFSPAHPEEGDIVQFLDLSYDPDPGDSIASRTWVINGETFTDQNPYFLFEDEANFVASITVSDTTGAVTLALDNTAALDGDPIPDLVVGNAAPLVNALNLEVLAGDDVNLRGRFLDQGFLDTHTGEWSITGDPLAAVEEENDPLLSTGLVKGLLAPSASLSGTLTVDDHDMGNAACVPGQDTWCDEFNITIVPDTEASLARHEPNDVANDPQNPPPVLESDNGIVSFIQQDGDVDIFEVRAQSGAEIKSGSEILIQATNLNADVDIAILSKLPTEAAAKWGNFGWPEYTGSKLTFGETDSSAQSWSALKWGNFKWGNFKWGNFGDVEIGLDTFNKSGVSWSDIKWGNFKWGSFDDAEGNKVEAIDVNLEELGLGQVGDDIQVADFSANRGLDDESAWARAATPGSSYYVAVFTSDGEQSLTPYTLSAEIIEPPDLDVDLGSLCVGSPLVTTGATGTPVVLYNYDDPLTPEDDAAESVLVTQWERLIATYGLDNQGQADLLNDLILLAQHAKVKADIYSVPSTIFNTADTEKCNVDATNSVTTQIRSLLSANYPNAENYVLVGSDDIIPFRRALDYTIIGNEKNYALDSFLLAGSKLFAAVFQGYMLTDDYYGDDTGAPWVGDEAWVPVNGIGRLVETPLEIRAQAQAAVASNLTLNPATGSVFGYDFFNDGADAIGDNLDAGLPGPVERVKSDPLDAEPPWTADDMRCILLGIGGPECGVRDIASPNGHSTHFGVLSADGFENDNFADMMSSTDVAAAGGGTPVLGGTLVFTIGCHAGFNAPDSSMFEAEPELGVDSALDLAQAMAQQRALFVASTGFGLGDTEGVGGHERLMALLPQELLKGGVTVGEAMSSAKQLYLGSVNPMTVYDMKVSMETTLYGLPQYEVDPAEAITLQAVPVVETLGDPAGDFSLTTADPGSTAPTVTTTHSLESVSRPKGTFYQLDGESQGGPGRTLQPSFALNVDERHPYPGAAPPVHGVRLRGASYTDIASDPVFARPSFEWEVIDPTKSLEECQAGYSPSTVGEVNTFQRGQIFKQTLVGVAGQFRCTGGAAANVTGIERLYDSLSVELRRCAGDELDGPIVNDLELRDLGGGTVEVRIDVSDDRGIYRLEVLRVDEGQIVPFTTTLSGPFPADGIFNINVPGVEQATDLLVQVEDSDCNVTLDTFKSAGLNFLKVDAGQDQFMPANRTVTLTGTIENYDDLVSPVWFDWEFGDGTFFDGVLLPVELRTPGLTVTVDEFGTAAFSVEHTYAGGLRTPITATLEVHDSAGGNGSDEMHIVCDPIGDAESPDGDLVGCGSSNDTSKMTISVTVDGAITDQFQYRVYVDAGKYNSKKKTWAPGPDGAFDAQLKYNGGQVTGLPSLTVRCEHEGELPGPCAVGDKVLLFTFNRSEFGLDKDEEVRWYAETQAGTPGTPATGKIDRMPDAGWLSHTIK